MTKEIEALMMEGSNGELQFYEITPLQKRVLSELPVFDEEDLYYEIERIYGIMTDDEGTFSPNEIKLFIDTLPVTPSLSKKLNVNRSTLVTALNRKNGYRKSLEEMGIVRQLLLDGEGFRYPLAYFYKICEENIVLHEFEEKGNTNRETLTPGYNKWKTNVLQRDKACKCCGLDKHLQVHHLFGYKEHPELATDIGNGVTLCKFCHDKYHSVYGLKNINPLDYVEFVKRFGVIK